MRYGDIDFLPQDSINSEISGSAIRIREQNGYASTLAISIFKPIYISNPVYGTYMHRNVPTRK